MPGRFNEDRASPDKAALLAAAQVEALGAKMGGQEAERFRKQYTGMIRTHYPSRAPAEEEVFSQSAAVQGTPRADWLSEDWLRLLEPWVASVREQVFGSPGPPFGANEWDSAVAWIEDEKRREFLDIGARQAEFVGSEEYQERKERARADAEWLAEGSGLGFIFDVVPLPRLSYKTRDEGRTVAAEALRGGSLILLAVAADAISALVGFNPEDVTELLLTGNPPALPRTRTRAYFVSRLGPGSKIWPVPRVTVDFHVDDIRHEDLRTLHTEIRQAWKALRAAGSQVQKQAGRRTAGRGKGDGRNAGRSPVSKVRAGGRLAQEDLCLRSIIDKLGAPPKRGGNTTWDDVEKLWNSQGYNEGRRKRVTAEALRKRWERLVAKVDNLHPSQREEREVGPVHRRQPPPTQEG